MLKCLPHTPQSIAMSAHFPELCTEQSPVEAEWECRRWYCGDGIATIFMEKKPREIVSGKWADNPDSCVWTSGRLVNWMSFLVVFKAPSWGRERIVKFQLWQGPSLGYNMVVLPWWSMNLPEGLLAMAPQPALPVGSCCTCYWGFRTSSCTLIQ